MCEIPRIGHGKQRCKASPRNLQKRILDAETKCGSALADANAAADRGAKATAEKLYEHSQRWLDKANKLRGWN